MTEKTTMKPEGGSGFLDPADPLGPAKSHGPANPRGPANPFSPANPLYNRPYFFEQGLWFKCQRCGACCTGEPGIIYVSKEEITTISNYIQVAPAELIGKYLYPYQESYSIHQHLDGRCYFYGSKGCEIYPIRPLQCSTYPVWNVNLRSKAAWHRAGEECPGIGSGVHYSKEQLLEILQVAPV